MLDIVKKNSKAGFIIYFLLVKGKLSFKKQKLNFIHLLLRSQNFIVNFLFSHNKNLQILYSYFIIYYLEIYTKIFTHPIFILFFLLFAFFFITIIILKKIELIFLSFYLFKFIINILKFKIKRNYPLLHPEELQIPFHKNIHNSQPPIPHNHLF